MQFDFKLAILELIHILINEVSYVYNQDLKERFLSTRTGGIKKCRRVFELISDEERRQQKDISEMDREEFVACIKTTQRVYIATFTDDFRFMVNYAQWIQETTGKSVPWLGKIDFYNAYLEADNFMPLLLWRDVYEELMQVYPMTEGFIIWPVATLAWLGLNRQECCNLKNEDVDLSHRLIKLPDRIIHIDDATQWKVLNLYAHTKQGVRTQNRTFLVELMDCGYFLKITKSHNSGKEVRKVPDYQITEAFNVYATKCVEMQRTPLFSFTDIWRMGRYHELGKIESQDPEFKTIGRNGIKKLFKAEGNVLNGQMILTEYQLYKKKLEERRKLEFGIS